MLDLDQKILFFINGSQSLFLDNLAYVLTSGITWIPLYLALLYLVIKNNETMKQILLIIGFALVCVLLSEFVTDFIIKPIVGRLRPTIDPSIKYLVHTVDNLRGSQYSFFSAHAANTCCIAVFFSLLIRNSIFTAAMLIWSILNCWTRVYLGLHYPSDIFCGFLYGAIVGLCIYVIFLKLYFKFSPKFNYISSQYTSTGYCLTDVEAVLIVLAFTFIYAIVRALIIFV